MIDTKQLIEYAKQPELALQNLSELLEQLESGDETNQNYSSEALENCGPPRSQDIETLLSQLDSGGTQQIYWASTLLGRLEATARNSPHFLRIQDGLCRTARNSKVDLSARERAVWALGQFGSLDASITEVLRPLVSQSPPRLQRLLEAALSKST